MEWKPDHEYSLNDVIAAQAAFRAAYPDVAKWQDHARKQTPLEADIASFEKWQNGFPLAWSSSHFDRFDDGEVEFAAIHVALLLSKESHITENPRDERESQSTHE